jgi:hypothetical protein
MKTDKETGNADLYKTFRPGDTVIWIGPQTFNKKWWKGLSEKDRIKYYGALGYGRKKPLLFTFLCEHHPQNGHCMLVNMENQKIETMRHICEFRLAGDDEC